MRLSDLQRWTLYLFAFGLVILAGWSGDTSVHIHGGITAPYLNGIITRLVTAMIACILAVAAKYSDRGVKLCTLAAEYSS